MNANHLDLKYIEHCTDAFCNTVESLKTGHHWRKTALRKSDREAKQSVSPLYCPSYGGLRFVVCPLQLKFEKISINWITMPEQAKG